MRFELVEGGGEGFCYREAELDEILEPGTPLPTSQVTKTAEREGAFGIYAEDFTPHPVGIKNVSWHLNGNHQD